jgi:hypothetical protein
VNKLKELYTILSNELRFIIKRMTRFANKNKSKKLNLRERSIIYLLKTNIKTKRKSDKLDFKKLRLFKIKKQLGPVTF